MAGKTADAGTKAREQYSGAGTEAGWLMGILKRKIVDLVRRRNRADSAAGGDSQPDPVELLFDSKGNWRVDPRLARGRPEAALEREEFWGAFRACLDHLPQRQADVFTLRELEEVESKGLGFRIDGAAVYLSRAVASRNALGDVPLVLRLFPADSALAHRRAARAPAGRSLQASHVI